MSAMWVRTALTLALCIPPCPLPALVVYPILSGDRISILPPAVDSGGTTVAFASTVAPSSAAALVFDIYAVAADGSNLRLLTQFSKRADLGFSANAVALSPDGKLVAYTTRAPVTSSAGGEEVHVIDVGTSADRVVDVYTEGCIQPLVALCIGYYAPCVHEPHFSADGSRVLFAVSRNFPFYLVNADGTGLTTLPVYSGALASGAACVISRNGLVVFTSSAPNGQTVAAAGTDVWLMNLDGSNIRALTAFSNNVSLYARNAAISADGSAVAFESNFAGAGNPPSQTTQIWVVGTDGKGLRQLTTGSTPATNPTLSADGSLVAFAQNGQVWSVRADGTGLKQLTSFRQSVAQNPVLSGNGSLVVFAVGPYAGQAGAIEAVAPDGSNLHSVYSPPVVNPTGIAAAAGYGPPAAGSLISVYGANFAPDILAAATTFPLPQSLGGAALLVNGNPVPLLAVTPWQINAQLPANLPAGTAAFQVVSAGLQASAAVSVEVKSIAPVVFSFPVQSAGGAGGFPQAAVFHAGTATPCDQAHPAAPGEAVEIYGTGLGATNPLVPAGQPAPASPPAWTVAQPDVLIAGQFTAKVLFSGLAPGLAGVYQVNVVIPSGLRPGQYAITWKVGSAAGDSTGTFSVR